MLIPNHFTNGEQNKYDEKNNNDFDATASKETSFHTPGLLQEYVRWQQQSKSKPEVYN